MFNLFSRISLCLFVLSFFVYTAYAGNATPLEGCNPQGILDYQSAGIPQGVTCRISPVTAGAPNPFPATPAGNSTGSTNTINFTSSGTFSYSLSCAGSNSIPPSDTATFNVTIPSSCNAGTYSISASPNPVQVCSPATQGSSMISWSAPTSQGVNVYVNGNPFGSSVGVGSQNAPWIQVGQNYNFVLRKANSSTDEANVSVTGTTVGCNTGGTGYCGDSSTQTPNASGVNEQCDLGSQNGQSGSTCSATCQTQTPSQICGNSVREGTEQCDLGSQNGQSGSTCSATCQTVSAGGTCGDGVVQYPNSNGQYEECDEAGANGSSGGSCGATCLFQAPAGTPFANIGFNSSYTEKNKSVQLGAGQTTVSQVLYLISTEITPTDFCRVEKRNGSVWQYYIGTINHNSSQTRVATNLAAGVHDFRFVCPHSGGVNVTSGTATLTVTNPATIDIGWTSSYSPKSKSVTVASGGTSNESLYVTTAGRSDCSLSGYMNSGNQTGITNVSATPGFAYLVQAPVGNRSYTLTCGSDTAVATLNITTSSGPTVSCTPSPQNVPATFNLTASGFSVEPTCNVTLSGVSQGSVSVPGTLTKSTPGTYVVSCSGGGQSASANCVAQSSAPINSYACINNACSTACGGKNQPECAFGNSGQCSASGCGVDDTLNAACLTSPVVTPTSVRSGQTFSVSVPFTNTGGRAWNPSLRTYTANATSNTSGWNMSRSLSTLISGTPSSGTFNANFSFVAPSVSTQTSFSLSFRMAENAIPFGSACVVSGSGSVVVDPAQCSDGVDNVDGEDTLVDALDPGCWTDPTDSGTYNPNDDNEQDPSLGVILKISANPQLVRQGGSSNVSYEVGSCSVLNNKGALVPATWTLTQDGVERATGTETSGGPQTYPVYDIQVKTTFTLSCGGSAKSATISVIKINEI